MLKIVIGFILGYLVASNKEQAKVYWENLKTWFKEKCNKDTQNNKVK